LTRPRFVTSVAISAGGGPHEYVAVWIRGANAGTLCVGKGDGERLSLALRGCHCLDGYLDRHGEHRLSCPIPGEDSEAVQ
jgi:hypothetical protein